MLRRRNPDSEAGPSNSELQRMAAFMEFMDRGWPRPTPGLAAMAMHPFDDAVEPSNRAWEDNTRMASMAFAMQLRTLQDPNSVADLARDVLIGYRETAIAAGEPYYSRRYDKTLDSIGDQ